MGAWVSNVKALYVPRVLLLGMPAQGLALSCGSDVIQWLVYLRLSASELQRRVSLPRSPVEHPGRHSQNTNPTWTHWGLSHCIRYLPLWLKPHVGSRWKTWAPLSHEAWGYCGVERERHSQFLLLPLPVLYLVFSRTESRTERYPLPFECLNQ